MGTPAPSRVRSSARLRGLLFAVLCALGVSPAPAGADNLADLANAARRARPGPFGSIEFHSPALETLPQWNGLLVRSAAEMPAFAACVVDVARCGNAAHTVWRDAVLSAAGLPRQDQLDFINRYFNRWPYRTDQSVHGVSEHWATPLEFLMRSGDCEDFSIAKYFALRALGYRADELRIVVLEDRVRGIGHAVLVVYGGGDIQVLDNLSNQVLSHLLYRHYLPQYSVNESARWLHVAPGTRGLTN